MNNAGCSDSISEHGGPIRDCRFLPGAYFMIDRCGMRMRIPLHQLRVGIYVAGIDCSWFRTPFLNRFLLQTVEQIERLRPSNIHYPRRGYRPLQRARRHVLPDSGRDPSRDWLALLDPITPST